MARQVRRVSFGSRPLVTRRRVIISGASIGLGAAAMAVVGCDGKDDGGVAGDKSGLLSKPVDTTRQAVRGGALPSYIELDAASLDPLSASVAGDGVKAAYAYSRLLKFKVSEPLKPPDGSVEGDAAASWEISGDGLQVTFKLRPDVRFDQRAPTSGRALDANDVKFSFDKYARLGRLRGDYFNSVNKDAPIASYEAPDKSTFVVKMAFPYAPALESFANAGALLLAPVESDGGFNPRSDMRGSGAWTLEEWAPSARMVWRRNPNWYIKERPYFDRIEQPLISEYATGVAQLVAGRLATYEVKQEEVLQIKRQQQNLLLRQATDWDRSVGRLLHFSARTTQPYVDERVRRAISMLIDRDLLMELDYNLSGFKNAGLPVASRWDGFVSAGEPVWLDPQGKEIGEGGRYFKHDPAEARKLIQATGLTLPIQDDFTYRPAPANTPIYQALVGELNASGLFRLRENTPDNTTVIVPRYNQSRGDFDGMSPVSVGTTGVALDAATFRYYHSGAGNFYWSAVVDRQMEDYLERARREFDRQKRDALYKDFQRRAAIVQPLVVFSGKALQFSLTWPWLGNAGVYSSWVSSSASQEHITYLWYDASKAQS